jgi:hypothetical protein
MSKTNSTYLKTTLNNNSNENCSLQFQTIYSAFFLTVAIGNVKITPPVNFRSDENIQTIFGIKFEDFLSHFLG